MRKYYAAGGRRVAMRDAERGVVYYLHGDHPSLCSGQALGSTSLVTCGSTGGCKGTPYQGVVAEQLYLPYGAPRWSTGTLPTDFTYTGQRADATGLMFYKARYYAASLGRFVSADTIVPSPGNPQSLNRYSYTLNNALKFIDPTGHFSEAEIKSFGVKTWDEVLAFFEKGRVLFGRWGWLETLRRAEYGDTIRVGSETIGYFFDQGGYVTVNHQVPDENSKKYGYFPPLVMEKLTYNYVVSQITKANVFDTYEIEGWRSLFCEHYKFTTPATKKYNQIRLDRDKVDWTNVVLDLASTFGSVVGANKAGQAAKFARYGTIVSRASTFAGAGKNVAQGKMDAPTAILSAASFVAPGWWGAGFSALCVANDFRYGLSYGP